MYFICVMAVTHVTTLVEFTTLQDSANHIKWTKLIQHQLEMLNTATSQDPL